LAATLTKWSQQKLFDPWFPMAGLNQAGRKSLYLLPDAGPTVESRSFKVSGSSMLPDCRLRIRLLLRFLHLCG
jgi:hypothetical protein